MSDPASKPPKPTRPQFTLRRLLKWIFVLCVLLAIGRWIYVRTWLQSQIVTELHALDTDSNVYCHWPLNRIELGKYGQWAGNGHVRTGMVVTGVRINFPLQSDADALRVNQLLRQLPHLQSMIAGNSSVDCPIAERLKRSEQHFGIATRGLGVRSVSFDWEMAGSRTAAFIRDTPSVVRVETHFTGEPTLNAFKSICLAPHVRELALGNVTLTADHLRILESATHLDSLGIYGDFPHGQLSSLGKLPHCDLQLRVQDVGDRDLREVIAKLPNLTHLSLFLEAPSDDAVKSLATAPRLQSLSLQDSTVTDTAIMALAESKSLEELNVVGTDVTLEALEHFAKCKSLRDLIVSESMDRGRLQAVLGPDVKLHWFNRPVDADRLRLRYREERRLAAEARRASENSAADAAGPMPD